MPTASVVEDEDIVLPPTLPRGRGRPKGSLNITNKTKTVTPVVPLTNTHLPVTENGIEHASLEPRISDLEGYVPGVHNWIYILDTEDDGSLYGKCYTNDPDMLKYFPGSTQWCQKRSFLNDFSMRSSVRAIGKSGNFNIVIIVDGIRLE